MHRLQKECQQCELLGDLIRNATGNHKQGEPASVLVSCLPCQLRLATQCVLCIAGINNVDILPQIAPCKDEDDR
jgi:hypothetical protein